MHNHGLDAHHAAHQHALDMHRSAHQRAIETHRSAHQHALDTQDAYRVATEHRRREHRRREDPRQRVNHGASATRTGSGRGGAVAGLVGLIRFVVNLAVLAVVIGGVLLVLRPKDPVWLAHIVDQLDVLVRTLRGVVS